jgi:glycine hydroxymethyltransferase
MILDLRKFDITGKEMSRRLDEVYITVSKSTIPDDPQSPFVTSGIRLGTPAVTTRGFKEAEMDLIAECVYLTATDFDNSADKIRGMVNDMCAKFPLYE